MSTGPDNDIESLLDWLIRYADLNGRLLTLTITDGGKTQLGIGENAYCGNCPHEAMFVAVRTVIREHEATIAAINSRCAINGVVL